MRNVRRARQGAPVRPRQVLRRRGTRLAGASNSRVVTNFIDQPLPVASDMITSRRFEVIATATGVGAYTVSTKQLVDALPGTSTVWDKVQFHRFDLFADAPDAVGNYSPLSVTVTNPASGYFGDVPTGYADSVNGARRAHVGVIMNELFKETWIDSSDVSPLLTITSAGPTNSSAIVQFVCILRSTAGIIPGAAASDVSDPRHRAKHLNLQAPGGEPLLHSGFDGTLPTRFDSAVAISCNGVRP